MITNVFFITKIFHVNNTNFFRQEKDLRDHEIEPETGAIHVADAAYGARETMPTPAPRDPRTFATRQRILPRPSELSGGLVRQVGPERRCLRRRFARPGRTPPR